MFLLLILMLCVFFLLGLILHRTLINYVSIFTGVWLIVLLLHRMELSYHLGAISEKTTWYLLGIFSSFVLGYFYIMLFYLPKYKAKSYYKESKVIDYQKYLRFFFNQKKVENFFLLSFILIMVCMFLQVIYSGGLPAIWLLTGDSRTYFDFGIPTFNGLVMSYLVLVTSLFYLISRFNTRKLYKVILFILLAVPILTVSRQVLIAMVFQILLLQHLFIKKFKVKDVLVYGFVILVVFAIMGNLRTNIESFERVAALKTEDLNYFNSIFYWVYMYFTMSLANINNLFTYISFDYGKGLYTLDNFLPTIFLEAMAKEPKEILFLVHPNFNVSGYMVNSYLDYGVIGVIVYTGLMGVLACLIYHKYKFKKDLYNTLSFVVFLQIITLSFFTDFLVYLPVSFQLVWIFLMSIFLKPRISKYVDDSQVTRMIK